MDDALDLENTVPLTDLSHYQSLAKLNQVV